MTIEKIRQKVESQKGKTLNFKFNGARNQTEEFAGTIIGTYPGIFLVKTGDDLQIIKSFSYSDILTLHLEIKENF